MKEELRAFTEMHRFHGTIALGKSGEILHSLSSGNSDLMQPCRQQTQYAIGSLTKQFTATALLRAILDYKCSGDAKCLSEQLQMPIARYLEDGHPLWNKGQAPVWANTVTLHNLLSQTSGIPDVTMDEYQEFNQEPHSRSEVAELYCKNKKLNFESGSNYEYSAANYFLAGVIVEALSRKTLGNYLKETFFIPLGMNDSTLPDAGTVTSLREHKEFSELAIGYTYSFKKDEAIQPYNNYFRAENNQGEGGLISTASDLIKWNNAFYESEKLLPKEAKALMLTKGKFSSYGYGISIEEYDQHVIYSHDGFVPGYQSTMAYAPHSKITMLHLSNVSQDPEQFVDFMTKYQGLESLEEPQKEIQEKLLEKEYPLAEKLSDEYRLLKIEDLKNWFSKSKHEISDRNSSLQNLKFSQPTGSYSVGYKNIEVTDQSRQDPYSLEPHRKIKITVYYPSNDVSRLEPYGAEETTFWERELKEPLESEEVTLGEFKSIVRAIRRIRVFKSSSATPAIGLFPVLLFEHGLGVTAGSYQSILLELVSHGYIVIAPSHPHIAATVIFTDGAKAFFKAERNQLVFETAFQDTQFVLNKIDEIASVIPSMNLNKIGMMGHSLGGATTIKTTRINPRIKAGISLDPPISHDAYDYDGDEHTVHELDSNINLDYGSDFEKPFLHIFAAKPMCDHSEIHLTDNNFKAVINRTEHNSFADHAILKDMISVIKEKEWHLGAGPANALSYQSDMIHLIRIFFNTFLKNKPTNLLDLNSNTITIETTKRLNLNFEQEKLLWSWNNKLAEEERLRQFSKNYYERHRDTKARGYGSGAVVIYK